jgi:predicted transcriptional regulator
MPKTTEGPKPGGESVIMSLRLPRDLKSQMEELAKRSGRSTNNLIVWLLQNFVKMPLQEKARVNPGYIEDEDFSDLLRGKKKRKEHHK